MQKLKIYPNGLKLAVKTLPGILSVSSGIFVSAGSADEDTQINGISHYIEHMLFKGTKNRSAFEISDTIDRIGAQINAFTTKEVTCFYTKSTGEHVEKAIEVLSDMFFNSNFDDAEAEKEKNVIVEEIAMVEDTPDEVCIEGLSSAFYNGHTLGKSIIGTEDNVRGFTKGDIKNYMNRFYTPENTVIVLSGGISFKQAEELVEKYFINNDFKNYDETPQRYRERIKQPRSFIKHKEIEQAHIALSFDSPKFDSKLSNHVALINMMLGGGMSSRLFQEVREKQGLAYSVYSYPSAYRNSGMFTVYAAVNPSSASKAVSVINSEIKKLVSEKFTKEEFLRGKEQLKSGLVFSQESSSSIMNAFGRFTSITDKLLSIEKKMADLDALEMDDIADLLDNGFFNFKNLCSSYVGKEKFSINIADIIKQ